MAERRGAVDSGDDDDRDQGKHVDTPELFIITFIRIYYLVYLTYSHLNLVDKLFCPIPHRIIVGWLGSCTFIRTTRFACGLGKVPRIRWWSQQSLGYKYLEH